MPCDVRGNTIICSRGSRKAPRCADCGQPSSLLCDGPLPDGIIHRRSSVPGADTTCSRNLCTRCARRQHGKDYCAICWPKLQASAEGR